MIGGTAQHDAVKSAHFSLGLPECAEPAIQDDAEMREVCLQLMNAGVVEGRNFPVFLGAEALQPGLAGVNYKSVATGCGNIRNECIKSLIFILIVDADAAFDRHRNFNRPAHRRDAVAHSLRVRP